MAPGTPAEGLPAIVSRIRAWDRSACGRPAATASGWRLYSPLSTCSNVLIAGKTNPGPKSARQKGECAGPPTYPRFNHPFSQRLDLLLPHLGMTIFDCRQTAIDLRDSRIRLDFRKRPVEMCAIDLTLEVGAIARFLGGFRHSAGLALSCVEEHRFFLSAPSLDGKRFA